MTNLTTKPASSKSTIFNKVLSVFKPFSKEVLLKYCTGVENIGGRQLKIVFQLVHHDQLIEKLRTRDYEGLMVDSVSMPLEIARSFSNFTLFKGRKLLSRAESLIEDDFIGRNINSLQSIRFPTYRYSINTSIQKIFKNDVRFKNTEFPVVQYMLPKSSIRTGYDSIIIPTYELIRKFLIPDDYFEVLLDGKFQNGEIIDFDKLKKFKEGNPDTKVGNLYFKSNYEYLTHSNHVNRTLGLACYDETTFKKVKNLRLLIERASYISSIKNTSKFNFPNIGVPSSNGYVAQVCGRVLTNSYERHFLVDCIVHLRIDYPCHSFTPILPESLKRPKANEPIPEKNRVPRPKRNIKEESEDVELNSDAQAPIDGDPHRIITDNIFGDLPPINPPKYNEEIGTNDFGFFSVEGEMATELTDQGTTGEGDEGAKKATTHSNTHIESDDTEIENIISWLDRHEDLTYKSVILGNRRYQTKRGVITTYLKDSLDLWSNVNDGRPILVAEILVNNLLPELKDSKNLYVYLLRPTSYPTETHRSVIVTKTNFGLMNQGELEIILKTSSWQNAKWKNTFEQLDANSNTYRYKQHNSQFLEEAKFTPFLLRTVKSLL